MKEKEGLKSESDKVSDIEKKIEALIRKKKTENQAFEKLLKALNEIQSTNNKNV